MRPILWSTVQSQNTKATKTTSPKKFTSHSSHRNNQKMQLSISSGGTKITTFFILNNKKDFKKTKVVEILRQILKKKKNCL